MGIIPFLDFNVESKILNQASIFKRAWDQYRATSIPTGKAYQNTSPQDLARAQQQNLWYKEMLRHTTERKPSVSKIQSSAGGKINEFVSYIGNHGLANPNTFKVYVYSPHVPASGYKTGYEVSLMAESVQLPPSQLKTFSERTYGPSILLPFSKELSPITVTFYVDSNYTTKRFFDDWVNKIYDQDTRDIGFYDDYVGSLSIFQLDKFEDNEVYNILLTDAYPMSVSLTDLNHNSTNQFHKLSVTFTYSSIQLLLINTLKPVTQNPGVREEMNKAAGLRDGRGEGDRLAAERMNTAFSGDQQARLTNMAAKASKTNTSLKGFRPGLAGVIEGLGINMPGKSLSSSPSNSVTTVTNATKSQLNRFGLI